MRRRGDHNIWWHRIKIQGQHILPLASYDYDDVAPSPISSGFASRRWSAAPTSSFTPFSARSTRLCRSAGGGAGDTLLLVARADEEVRARHDLLIGREVVPRHRPEALHALAAQNLPGSLRDHAGQSLVVDYRRGHRPVVKGVARAASGDPQDDVLHRLGHPLPRLFTEGPDGPGEIYLVRDTLYTSASEARCVTESTVFSLGATSRETAVCSL